jgi:hypothetical protein
MQIKLFTAAFILSLFASSAAYPGQFCYDVAEGSPKTILGRISLYPSSEYYLRFDEFSELISTANGIPCTHRDSSKLETLQCTNGILATGISTSRPCTFDERYAPGDSVDARITAYLCTKFGTIGEKNWKLVDRNGQKFTDFSKEWKSKSPNSGCVLTSAGNYEERGFRILTLQAGDKRLYFIREERSIYTPKRQPAL